MSEGSPKSKEELIEALADAEESIMFIKAENGKLKEDNSQFFCLKIELILWIVGLFLLNVFLIIWIMTNKQMPNVK